MKSFFSVSFPERSIAETIKELYPSVDPEKRAFPYNAMDWCRYLWYDQLTIPAGLECTRTGLFGGSLLLPSHPLRLTNVWGNGGYFPEPTRCEVVQIRVWIVDRRQTPEDLSKITCRFFIGNKVYYEAPLIAFPHDDDLDPDPEMRHGHLPEGERLLIYAGLRFSVEFEGLPRRPMIIGTALDTNTGRGVQ